VTPIRILIVDDDPILRAGLLGLLASEEEFIVIGEAANGLEAVALVRHACPDVLLIDLRMPEMDGVSAIRAMRAFVPELRVLVLTTYDSDADILRAVEAGATGYLLEETPREELFAAIRATARGQSVRSPTVASRLVSRTRDSIERARPPNERREPHGMRVRSLDQACTYNLTEPRVPIAAALLLTMVPACADTMCRATLRPRPLPSFLVEKNGSNTREICSAGSPEPESQHRLIVHTRGGGPKKRSERLAKNGPAFTDPPQIPYDGVIRSGDDLSDGGRYFLVKRRTVLANAQTKVVEYQRTSRRRKKPLCV